jgi:23S rRNA (cytosine1962-C5)-methyltransferase
MHVTLRPHKEKDLREGYPWVFANQIAGVSGRPARGDVVAVRAADGTPLGQGFYHEASLIAVRMLTNDATTSIDDDFFRQRLEAAFRLRTSCFPDATHYRLAFSESDGLPGTVIDRYGDVLTWTTLCYGMEQRREVLLDALEALVHPTAIVERNDGALRAKDHLPEAKGVLRGQYDGPVEIEEHGVRFRVDVLDGPKTGFFIDQRLHRSMLRTFAPGRRVLDVCCADGGFGLLAAAAGAASVHLLDISAAALIRAQHNANRNGLAVRTEQADALERLGQMVQEDARYDLIILDPPGFARSRRHLEEAVHAYQRLNINALQLLEPDGLLATASCSQALEEAAFLKLVRYSARKAGTGLRLLYRGGQPPDHPILLSMPETHYLKFFVFQKMAF